MRNRLLASFILLFLIGRLGCADDSLDDKAAQIARNNENGALQKVSPEERIGVIKRLKAMQKPAPAYDSTQISIQKALLNLNDEDAISAAIKDFHSTDFDTRNMGFLLLTAWGEVGIIPPLMEDVLNGSTKPVELKDNPDYALDIQTSAVMIVLRCIGHSAALPSNTSTWAHKLISPPFPDSSLHSQREMLIEWWSHNQKAIQAGNYDKASWLPN